MPAITFIKVIFLFTFLVLFSCKSYREASHNKKQYKETYLGQFKLTYFKKLLLESYNYSEHVRALVRSDRSGFTEPILSERDNNLIDSLVKADNKLLVEDSVASIGRVAEGAQGKHTLGYVMYKIRSKWLDSLALDSYKRSETKSF